MKQFVALVAFVMLLAAPTLAAAQSNDSMSGMTTDMAQASSAGVTIVDFAFQPSYITVPAGTTVTWYNAGAAPHTVTSSDGFFDSGTIGSGGSFSVTFSSPGTYNYACAIHPMM